jgi:hypothetical protein
MAKTASTAEAVNVGQQREQVRALQQQLREAREQLKAARPQQNPLERVWQCCAGCRRSVNRCRSGMH